MALRRTMMRWRTTWATSLRGMMTSWPHSRMGVMLPWQRSHASVLQRRPLRPSAAVPLRPCVCCAAAISQPWPLRCALASCLGLPSLQRAVVASALAFCLGHRQGASGVLTRGRGRQSAAVLCFMTLLLPQSDGSGLVAAPWTWRWREWRSARAGFSSQLGWGRRRRRQRAAVPCFLTLRAQTGVLLHLQCAATW